MERLSHWWKKIWKREKDENFFANPAMTPALEKMAEAKNDPLIVPDSEQAQVKQIRRKRNHKKRQKSRRQKLEAGKSRPWNPAKHGYPNSPTNIKPE